MSSLISLSILLIIQVLKTSGKISQVLGGFSGLSYNGKYCTQGLLVMFLNSKTFDKGMYQRWLIYDTTALKISSGFFSYKRCRFSHQHFVYEVFRYFNKRSEEFNVHQYKVNRKTNVICRWFHDLRSGLMQQSSFTKRLIFPFQWKEVLYIGPTMKTIKLVKCYTKEGRK